jgi:hypothetical protein
MHNHRGESFAEKDLPEELPVHSVIGLFKIEFQDQAPQLSGPEFMSDLVKS